MKKQNIKNFVVVIALCISAALSGCVAAANDTQEPNKSAADSSPHEEQAKAKKNRRAEIAKAYSIYESYGMTYDKENDRFSYNGQIVRCFKDQLSAEGTRSFFFDGGVIDVEAVRDVNGTLTGLKQSSDADFKARTEQHDCQTAHCGRCKPHFIFCELTFPIVPYRDLPQTLRGLTADCRSLV